MSLQIKKLKDVKSRSTKNAFSVAEAMITLLIVSLALAASAPLFTKKAKNDGISSTQAVIPPGAIMFFDKVDAYSGNNGCPQGWSAVNNSGRYIQITTDVNNIGSTLEDGLPNIEGTVTYVAETFETEAETTGAFSKVKGFQSKVDSTPKSTDSSPVGQLVFNASASNPIYGASTVVQPKSVLYVACRKL